MIGSVCLLLFVAPVLKPLPDSDSAFKGAAVLLDDREMIRVPVQAFGEELFFMVDTGSSISALDKAFRQHLGEPINSAEAETPLGETKSATYSGTKFSIGNLQIASGTIMTGDLRMAEFISGERCNGILGLSSLSNFIVTLNFDAETFGITARETVTNVWSEVIPLKQQADGRFSIAATLNGKVIDLLVDSGNSSSISLNERDWNLVFAGRSSDSATVRIAGVGGNFSESKTARIDETVIGKETWPDLLATLLPNQRSASSVGLGTLRRYNLAFDSPGKKLFLRKRIGVQHDEADMSGLHLLRIASKTIIHSVDTVSPAAKADLREDDRILSVDHKPVEVLAMKAIRRSLQSGDGKEVSLEIFRNGEVLKKTIVLKRSL